MRKKSAYKGTGYTDPAIKADIEASRSNLPAGKGPNWSNAYPSLGSRGTKLQAEGRARSQSLRPGPWNNYGPVSYTIPSEEMMQPRPPISSQPTSSTNPVDENGIPMVMTSIGWIKNPRFYKPDGTLFGTM